jgi:hypothetical protein
LLWHRWGNAQAHITPQRATLEPLATTMANASANSSGRYKESPQISNGDMIVDVQKSMGYTPGGETQDTHVGPGAPDVNDILQGLGTDGLASGASSASGYMPTCVPVATFQALIDETCCV